eukprot:g6439.t1
MKSLMNAENSATGVVALGPLRWNLAKIEQHWDQRVAALETEAAEKTREIECKHRVERRALAKRLKSSRDAAKANIPLNGRLATLKASRDNLNRLGRVEEAQKVQRKLEPLEKVFWAKALEGIGFQQEAKREKSELLSAQQAELGSLNLELRRDVERALQAKYAEVKAQQRKNRCSSDDVWSVWCAAKSGEAERLSYMLSLPRANVDVRDPDSGWTALHFASRQGKLPTVKVLIQNQAFVGARAPDGRTPLHLAAGWGTYEVCFALLQAGADKTVLDRDRKTSRDLAESRSRGKIAALLKDWKPIGLTATQTQKIKESRGEGPIRPWETEGDPEIKSQLRVLDMKRLTFGERHVGTHTTLGRLGGLCRAAGRLEDAKSHLERLVDLLQDTPRVGSSRGKRASLRQRGSCASALPRGRPGALSVALGNLGVVHHEIGDAEQASRFLEASLEATSSFSGDTSQKHVVDAATRNLGLHYLSEGRVDEACPLLRSCLATLEEALRPDMSGGDESLDLVSGLTVLSYAEMLTGDHTAAAESSERAQAIAAQYRRHGDAVNHLLPSAVVGKTESLSDPLPRLEWMGLQRFVAGDDSSAQDFFAQARKLVLLRVQEQRSWNTKTGASDAHVDGCRVAPTRDAKARGAPGGRTPGTIANAPNKNSGEGTSRDAETMAGEFHPDAMRLDRCMVVSICRQGPEAF